MKKILFIALMAGFAMTASAQISEGDPSAKTYTTGNRPEKGTFGLYFGIESDLFKGNLNDAGGFMKNPFPIVNLKYMLSDNLEARLGMKFWKQRETLKYGNDEDKDQGITEENFKNKYVEADNQFRPGIAYHFTKSNLLDVYAGVEGILGWRRQVTKTWSNDVDADIEISRTVRNRGIQFGAGAFIGLQAFIARLPLAIGFEYGISTKWDGALKQRTYNYRRVGSTETKETLFTQYDDPDKGLVHLAGASAGVGQKGGQFDHMKARKAAWGNQIRFTLSYYFNR
jgi:hypothetical protein